jgi:hypothetical protein
VLLYVASLKRIPMKRTPDQLPLIRVEIVPSSPGLT